MCVYSLCFFIIDIIMRMFIHVLIGQMLCRQHAGKIGLFRSRQKRTYKLPHVKKEFTRYKQADVVVIIMAGSGAKDGYCFPQADVWQAWAGGDVRVGFAVVTEGVDKTKGTWWEKFTVPLRGITAWGQWSILEAELSALTWAVESYPYAVCFHVVSGDSAPVRTIEQFCKKGIQSQLESDIHGGRSDFPIPIGYDEGIPKSIACVRVHSQWKVLTKVDVVSVLSLARTELPAWKGLWLSAFKQLKCKACFADAHGELGCPDEFFIGTVLLYEWSKARAVRSAVCASSLPYMAQKFDGGRDVSYCPAGRHVVGHAVAIDKVGEWVRLNVKRFHWCVRKCNTLIQRDEEYIRFMSELDNLPRTRALKL
jgi:hypothetical protein